MSLADQHLENKLRGLLYVAPLALCVGLVVGLGLATARVTTSGDLTFHLWRAMFSDFADAINLGVFTAFTLALLWLVLAGIQLPFGRPLAGAILSAAGMLLFYPLFLIVVWVATKMVVDTEAVGWHRLPDVLRNNTNFSLYLRDHYLAYLSPTGLLKLFVGRTGWLIASLAPAIACGLWLERGLRRLAPHWIERVARKLATPAPTADGRPARNPWAVRATVTVVLVAAFVVVVNIVAQGAALMHGEPRPNVILISLDTVRADHLGCYGNHADISPSLDRLAANGVLFEEAMANAPWTLPNHGAMLTGLQPSALGLFKVTDRLSGRALTLAEVLHNDGYDTGAIVSYILLDRVYGFDQGFDYFDYGDEQTSAEVVSKAIDYLRPRTKRKFFLFLHIWDAHWPYEPPAAAARKFWPGTLPPAVRQLVAETDYTRFALQVMRGPEVLNQYNRAMYDAEIYEVDRQLGRLFRFLMETEMINRTLIVVTSDHGEEFRDHGLVGHGLTLYDEVLHVPLIMRLPLMIPEGVRIKGQVQTIDLFPTILSLVGLDPTRFTLNGRDLVPWIQAGAAPPTPLLAETSMSGDTRYALRDGHYKLIQPYRLDFGGEMKINRPEEMFELTVDPGEQRNLAVPPSAQLEALRQELSRRIDLVRRERAAAGGRSRSKALSPQERDRLRSLGYIN